MAVADDMLAAINEEQAELEPELEGLRDYQRLNISSDTRVEVEESIVVYNRRTSLLQAAEDAINALIADGFPGIPDNDVSQTVHDDLQNQFDTIQAALETFNPVAQATSLKLEADPPEPK